MPTRATESSVPWERTSEAFTEPSIFKSTMRDEKVSWSCGYPPVQFREVPCTDVRQDTKYFVSEASVWDNDQNFGVSNGVECIRAQEHIGDLSQSVERQLFEPNKRFIHSYKTLFDDSCPCYSVLSTDPWKENTFRIMKSPMNESEDTRPRKPTIVHKKL